MNKALQSIGLARKAGQLTFGTQNVLECIRHKKAVLVIIASDASENTLKTLTDKCAFYGVEANKPCFTLTELGDILGSAACACAAFTDINFAQMYKQAIQQ